MKKPNFAAMNPVVAEAIQQIMAEQGDKFSLEEINLADLGRRTGISRAKLRRMKEHDFEDVQHALKGRKATTTLLSGYTSILDGLLKAGVVNSVVCLDKLRKSGFTGGKTITKTYRGISGVTYRTRVVVTTGVDNIDVASTERTI